LAGKLFTMLPLEDFAGTVVNESHRHLRKEMVLTRSSVMHRFGKFSVIQVDYLEVGLDLEYSASRYQMVTTSGPTWEIAQRDREEGKCKPWMTCCTWKDAPKL